MGLGDPKDGAAIMGGDEPWVGMVPEQEERALRLATVSVCGEARKAVGWRESFELEVGATMCSEVDSLTRSTVSPNYSPLEWKKYASQ